MISHKVWGKSDDGQEILLYTLQNENGNVLKITDFGARVVAFYVKDLQGKECDIVLGYDHAESYLNDPPCFGAVCGRFANRIADGKFTLNGTSYQLAINNGPNHLHGGVKGFDKQLWKATASETPEGPAITLKYLSKDMEEGYPGNLEIEVTYTLLMNAFRINYSAKTDRTTILNLTNHTYFNLNGQGEGDILRHTLQINAEKYTPKNSVDIPTGKIEDLAATVFDFRKPMMIGDHIDDPIDTLITSRGYDHNWVLDNAGTLRHVLTLASTTTKRSLQVWTTEPGVQIYTANWIEEGLQGKNGKVYGPRYGVAIETQHFPDSPNHDNFPSTILEAGKIYTQQTEYRVFH